MTRARPFTTHHRALTAAAMAALLGVAGPATARAVDPLTRLSPALGNTIVSTHPDGRQARLWLDRGGAYTARSRAGKHSGGVWRVTGEKLCLRQRRPFPIPFVYCKAIPVRSVGKPWRDKAVTGEIVTNEIVRGGEKTVARR